MAEVKHGAGCETTSEIWATRPEKGVSTLAHGPRDVYQQKKCALHVMMRFVKDDSGHFYR